MLNYSALACDCEEHSTDTKDKAVITKMNKIYADSKLVFSSAQIDKAAKKVAAEITEELKDSNPVVLSVLVGGLVCTSDLIKLLDFPLQLDYIHATRYKNDTVGGALHWVSEPTLSLHGRTVLIADDIFDKGVTMHSIVEYCKQHGAKNVYTFAFFNKKTEKAEGVKNVDFYALEVEDYYIFGYGMDIHSYFRNLNEVRAKV